MDAVDAITVRSLTRYGSGQSAPHHRQRAVVTPEPTGGGPPTRPLPARHSGRDPLRVRDPRRRRVVALAQRPVVVGPPLVQERELLAVEFDAEAGCVRNGDPAALEGQPFGEDVL